MFGFSGTYNPTPLHAQRCRNDVVTLSQRYRNDVATLSQRWCNPAQRCRNAVATLRNESNAIHTMSQSKNAHIPIEVAVETSVERLVESFLKTYFETTVFILQQLLLFKKYKSKTID